MMSAVTTLKRAVNLSLTASTVTAAREIGINLSEVADQALADAVARHDRDSLQARMDQEMQRWNQWAAKEISVADEYGTL